MSYENKKEEVGENFRKLKKIISVLLVIALIVVATPLSNGTIKAGTITEMASRGVTYQITDMGMVNGERMFEINYSDGSSSCLIISKSYVCCKKTDTEGEKSISFVDISGINEQVSENSSISIKTAIKNCFCVKQFSIWSKDL